MIFLTYIAYPKPEFGYASGKRRKLQIIGKDDVFSITVKYMVVLENRASRLKGFSNLKQRRKACYYTGARGKI